MADRKLLKQLSGPNQKNLCWRFYMAKKPIPSPDLLRQLLRYEPETGKLFWRERTPDMFKGHSAAACKSWNTRLAGKQAFFASHPCGYSQGYIQNHNYLGHRVIWAMVYGVWPTDDIDHINHDRSDNRITNLRAVSRLENMKNVSLLKANKSGYSGVFWREDAQKWKVSLRVEGRNKHLGYFSDIKSAAAARKKAEIKYGYHENHGN